MERLRKADRHDRGERRNRRIEPFLGSKVAGMSGVQIGPAGATPLTRIFLSTSCMANDRVNVTMAPLVAE